MSFLLDTDILSLLERKRVPPKLLAWMTANEPDCFLSVVSFAELQFGIDQAPATHQPKLRIWMAETRRKFAGATEPLSEPVLVCWKKLLSELKHKNRTLTCEDSLIAATALSNGHTVVTHNTKHFKEAGVQLLDPV